jgi:acetylglutamate kinase
MNVIVIKYGGSLLEEPGHRSAFLKDVAALAEKQKVILVHGGGKEISRQMEQSGLKPKFVNGRRFTDEATMAVVEKALSGLNNEIVGELIQLGAKAQGYSGRDNHLLQAISVAELGRVGMPSQVNSSALQSVLQNEAIPVFYSVAEDSKHNSLNINADDFALALAIDGRVDRLVFLTDTGGVLDGKGNLIPLIGPKEVNRLMADHILTGGMLVKVEACMNALERGVERVDMMKGIEYLLNPTHVKPEGTMFTHGH